MPGYSHSYCGARRLILSHELAHIKRWDALAEELASLVIVLHWFNPLVWLALRRLRIERERDCDNAVLRAGARPSDYAMQLLAVAADIGGVARLSWRCEEISQSSNLRDRLLHILDPDIRRVVASRQAVLLVGSLLFSVSLSLAGLGLWDDGSVIRRPAGVVLSEESQRYWSKGMELDRSAAYLVEQFLEASGIEAALTAYSAIAIRPRDRRWFYVREGEFNALGYRLLERGRNHEAIEIFKLNVGTFPTSWNVYDSLGEAYLISGDLKRAQQNYERSLELGSEDRNNARRILHELNLRKSTGTVHSEGLRSSMIPASTQ